MKIIIEAEPDELADVLALILREKRAFDQRPERLGWGWSHSIPSGKRFFLREIKGGISARPIKPEPPVQS